MAMVSKGKILVADDELILSSTLKKVLEDMGYTADVCTKGEEFFPILAETRPDVLVLDIFLGQVNGIDLLNRMRAEGWRQPVIMMTAHSDVSLAVRAMKEGAADFVVKPFDLNHLGVLIEKNLEHAHMEAKMRILQEEVEQVRSRNGIIGKSWALKHVLETMEKLAEGDNTTVLLEGESGTGKEVVARYLHQKSVRVEKPFVTLNCGAIPKELAESEFFGHEKGAFTGAGEKLKQGKFELADGGTILLDEIGELSLDMQVKLLRVLEDKRFYRLGGTKEIEVDVRIIAASNRDLMREVEDGRFREDLYYRLNVAAVKIPPLRNRREDIPELVGTFLREFCGRFSRPVPTITTEALRYLQQLPWRGNVRELRNAVERVVLLNNVPTLGVDHFAFLRSEPPPGAMIPASNGRNFVLEIPPTGVGMNEVMRQLIMKTLDLVGGNQVQAAKVLGLTRSKLRYRMEQLGIQPESRTYRASTGVR
jgi:two-component system, NtrC family, response regulator AtoC